MSSVQRKFLLYISGLIVALGVFLWLKGQFFPSGERGGDQSIKPLNIVQGTGATHISVENRNPQGVLEYVMRANLAKPVGGGEYQLIKPELQFYTAKGQSILVDSDTGDVVVGAAGGGGAGAGQIGSFGNPYLRKGTLTGHVTITTGPLNSFKRGVLARQPGQIQMTLGRPLHFDYQQGLLTSRGTVSVRGDQLQFDGSDLTVEINTANKTLEDLQIARGRKLVISGLFHQSAPASPAAAAKPSATQSASARTARNNSKGLTKPVKAVLTTYALSFGRHVQVALGAQTMLANRLRLYFQTAAKAPTGAGSPGTAAEEQSSTNSTPPAKRTRPSQHAVSKAKSPALVIHWTGPLALRPIRHSPVVLAGSRDVFLQATGDPGKPVVMHDGPTRTGFAGKVTYDSAQQDVTMQTTGKEPVKLRDKAMGSITCETLVYSNLTHRATLTGPGFFQMTGAGGGQNPWHGSWLKQLAVRLAPSQNTSKSTTPAIGQGKLAVKEIMLSGAAALTNNQTSLHAQTFTARFIQIAGKHSGSALSYFSADGDVAISSANAGLPSADANRMSCRHLVLLTRQAAAHSAPVPAELQAADHIALTFYQKPTKSGGIPEKFNITGGMLRARLISRSGLHTAETGAAADNLGGRYTIGRFRIWKNTVVHIYHIGRPITATAYELSGDRAAGTATLRSDSKGSIESTIYQGADWLKGRTITLQRKLEQVTVPGAGELSMPESSKAAQPRVEVSWLKQMRYSAKIKQAKLAGNVRVALVGRPDQHSSLQAPSMLIHFQRRKTDHNAMKLAQLIASGPMGRYTVVARDASYGKTGTLLTRMRLNCPKLIYNAVEGLLKIPAAGEMVLEDYRPATTANTAQQRGQSGFSWAHELTYNARTGLVNLRGKVRLRFRPTKPLPTPTTAAVGNAASHNSGMVLLDADEILAKLNHTGPAARNGVDLGMGGPTRLQHVTANTAELQVSGLNLAAGMLTFDAATEIAQAYGLNGQNAIFSNASGSIHGQARHIIWNLSKTSGGVTLIEPVGTANLP